MALRTSSRLADCRGDKLQHYGATRYDPVVWLGTACPPRHRISAPQPRHEHHARGSPRPDGRHLPWLSEGARATATCEWYITEQVAPTLRPGQVVGLENLSVHQAERIRHALESRHCQLLFLPPYSPDFTPIDQAVSKIKARWRGRGARTKEALQEAVRRAIEAITRHDAVAWFAHAGYALPAQDTCKLL